MHRTINSAKAEYGNTELSSIGRKHFPNVFIFTKMIWYNIKIENYIFDASDVSMV